MKNLFNGTWIQVCLVFAIIFMGLMVAVSLVHEPHAIHAQTEKPPVAVMYVFDNKHTGLTEQVNTILTSTIGNKECIEQDDRGCVIDIQYQFSCYTWNENGGACSHAAQILYRP